MSTQASPGKAGPLQLLLAQQPGARHADGRVQPVAPRDAALLAWLALEGPTPRNRLAALLWPDSPAETARNALRQRLFQLKRQFGDALLALRAQGLPMLVAEQNRILADRADRVLTLVSGRLAA